MRNRRTDSLSQRKIEPRSRIAKLSKRLKSRGKRIAFTNGCFDLLHYGHVRYLEEAKSKADILIVGLNSDCSVKKIKGNKRPIINEFDRARTLAALECVDHVVLFNETTPLRLIKSVAPDILIKGADWRKKDIVGFKEVTGNGGRVLTIKFLKGRSTTRLIKKIAQTN